MGSRKVNTEGIDEELLLASIGRRTQDGTLRPAQEVPATAPTEDDTAVPEPPPAQPVARERTQREGGRRKRQDEDYNELFLRRLLFLSSRIILPFLRSRSQRHGLYNR